MLFNSISFLIYFPIVILLYFVLPDRTKKLWLLIASYFFYMSWNIKYGLLILLSTIITYFCGIWIGSVKHDIYKKLALSFCLLSNLSILFFFKYFTWIFEEITHLIGSSATLSFSIVLPVGISFYTFQALGYTIDVYRGDIKAEKNFITYALFVSFFPQLVAGPIERSRNLLHQLQTPTQFNMQNATKGLQIMLWGYMEKMVIADNLSIVVDYVYNDWQNYSGSVLLFVTMLHAIQIYCDFGGYSHIAIGAARVLNVTLMDNFRQPLFSATIKELWQRWHISLSGWFRDYLYIPLGGNRKGRVRKYINLMITFLVSGLWHGASFHYVVWGGLNGLYQVIGEILLPIRKKLLKLFHVNAEGCCHRIVKIAVTYLLFAISLIFFRSTSVSDALHICGKVLCGMQIENLWDGTLLNIGLSLSQMLLLGIAIVLLFCVDLIHENGKHITTWFEKQNVCVRWGSYYLLIFMILISVVQTFGKSASAFLYFQF